MTDERDGYYADFGRVAQLAKALHRPHVHDGDYSSFRRRRFGAPADDVPPERFVVFSQNHDQVGNRAFGDRLPPRPGRWPRSARCSRRSRRCCSWARSTASTRRSSSSPTTSTRRSRRRRARAGGAEFAAFASFAEEIPDPAGPGDVRALEADRASATRRSPRCTRELLACAGGCPPGDADAIEFDEDARWLRVRRGAFELVCNFAAERVGACRAPAASVVLATHARAAARATARSSSSPPLSGALITVNDEVWPGQPFPLGADLGRRRHQLLALLRARRGASSCACSTTTATRRGSR